MTVELLMVVYSVIILLVMIGVQGAVGLINNGLIWGSSARDVAAKPTVLYGRSSRAVQNHVEAMCMFVPVVLALQIGGVSNDATLLWVKVFVGARIAYALFYWLGTPWARTIVWAAGLIATIMLVIQAF